MTGCCGSRAPSATRWSSCRSANSWRRRPPARSVDGRHTRSASPGRSGSSARTSPPFPASTLLIDSNVPVGAGLSSSAAIESAVGFALNEVWQLGLRARPWPSSGSAPRTTSSAPRPGSWTSPPRCSAARMPRCSSTAAASTRASSRSGFEAAGLTIAVIDTGRDALARDGRIPRAARLLRSGRPRTRGRGPARRERRRPGSRTRHPRRRHLPPRAARRHREPAGARHGAPARDGRPGRHRRAARRLAPLDARRLRDLGARARPGRRDRARRTARSARG